MGSLQQKSNRVLPMSIDTKILYSMAKMVYSTTYDVYKLQNVLRYCPRVYGVWHAYKYCCEAVHRKFFSLCIFLSSGPQSPDTDFCTHPKPIWKERLFMSLLLVVPQYLQQLKQRLCALQSASVGSRSVLQQQCLQQTEAMFNLLNDYVPSLFIWGMLVRDCNWCTGPRVQVPHPITQAQLLLNMFMLVLLRLFDGSEGSHEYLRTLAVAKLLWVPWHGTTPPSTHSEDSCEAMLSRFAEKLRQFPSTSCKLEGAIDLFLLVARAAGGKKDLQNSGLQQRVVDAIRMHPSMFVGDTDRVPHPAVELSYAPQVKVVGAWPESMAFPGSLRDPFSTPRLQDFLVKTLHTLTGAVDANNQTVDVFNSFCPRYTHREIAAARAERDHIFRQYPLPQ